MSWSPRPVTVRPGPPGLLNPVPAQRARLLLAQSDLGAAARLAQDNSLSPDDQPDYPREPDYLLLARVLLAQERPGQALLVPTSRRLYRAGKSQVSAQMYLACQSVACTCVGLCWVPAALSAGAVTDFPDPPEPIFRVHPKKVVENGFI